jgi:hypothetical protein
MQRKLRIFVRLPLGKPYFIAGISRRNDALLLAVGANRTNHDAASLWQLSVSAGARRDSA